MTDLRDILRDVAEHFNVPQSSLYATGPGVRVPARLAMIRGVAVYLMRREGASYPACARALRFAHHSCVLDGDKRTAARIAAGDAEIVAAVDALGGGASEAAAASVRAEHLTRRVRRLRRAIAVAEGRIVAMRRDLGETMARLAGVAAGPRP